eukprot:c16538_g2_i1 orf=1-687(-)
MLNIGSLLLDTFQDSMAITIEPNLNGVDNAAFKCMLVHEVKPRPVNTSRDSQRSEDKPLSDLASAGMSPRQSRPLETVKSSDCLETLVSPSMRSTSGTPRSDRPSFEPHPMVADAWENLRRSLVYFRGKPVGTIAALDPTEEALNYNQVFVRDFVPSALAFLMNSEPEIVKNFLLKTLHLQAWEKQIDCFTLGEGVMPASFKVLHNPVRNSDTMIADFGGSAIGRVAPV